MKVCLMSFDNESFTSLLKLNSFQIVSNNDNQIKIWDLTERKLVKTISGHTQYITCIIKIKKTKIASCSFDTTIKIWDSKSGDCLRTLVDQDNGELENLLKLNEAQIVSFNNSIKLWDLQTGSCIARIANDSHSILCSDKISKIHIITGGYDNNLKLWDLSLRLDN